MQQHVDNQPSDNKVDITGSVFGCISGGILLINMGISQGALLYKIVGYILFAPALLLLILSIAKSNPITLKLLKAVNNYTPLIIVPLSILSIFAKYIDSIKIAVDKGIKMDDELMALGIVILIFMGFWMYERIHSFSNDMRRKALKVISFDFGIFAMLYYWAYHIAQQNQLFICVVLLLALGLLAWSRFWDAKTKIQLALLSFGGTAFAFGLALSFSGSAAFDFSVNLLAIGILMISTSAILAENYLSRNIVQQ
jgi:hypothetical protein